MTEYIGVCSTIKDGKDCFSCTQDDCCDLGRKLESNSSSIDFIASFIELSAQVHQNAVDKGWWGDKRNDGEAIALMHSELSEALESMRNGNPESKKIPGFTNTEEELADTIIRIMDYAGGNNLRVAEALIAKVNYNRGRSYKHGGKKF